MNSNKPFKAFQESKISNSYLLLDNIGNIIKISVYIHMRNYRIFLKSTVSFEKRREKYQNISH